MCERQHTQTMADPDDGLSFENFPEEVKQRNKRNIVDKIVIKYLTNVNILDPSRDLGTASTIWPALLSPGL